MWHKSQENLNYDENNVFIFYILVYLPSITAYVFIITLFLSRPFIEAIVSMTSRASASDDNKPRLI